MPKEVHKILEDMEMKDNMLKGTKKSGTYLIKRIIINSIKHEETICGRLYLM